MSYGRPLPKPGSKQPHITPSQRELERQREQAMQERIEAAHADQRIAVLRELYGDL